MELTKELMLILSVAFVLKHLICDYPLQRWPWMFLNKGIYGHLGGITHGLVHGLGTAVIIYAATGNLSYSFASCCIDTIVHYHVDWAKVNLCTKYNLRPDNSEYYWHLLGLDQMLHYLTYIGLILIWA